MKNALITLIKNHKWGKDETLRRVGILFFTGSLSEADYNELLELINEEYTENTKEA